MTGFDPEPNLLVHLPLDEHAGPAPRIQRERALAMVERALEDFVSVPAAQPAITRWRSWPMLAAAAGALLVLVGGAAAARFYFHFGEPVSPSVQASRVLPSPAQPRAATPVSDAEETPTARLETETAPLPLKPTARAVRSASSDRDRAAPEDLLQKANHLRAAGQFQDAAQTYALVYERFPHSLSAYVARVAGAAIELEHLSSPTRARRLFEQALRDQPAGALDLEARQGLSVALRDLEDRSAEVRALQSLVARHPDSPAARRAQVRLREIGAPSASEQ